MGSTGEGHWKPFCHRKYVDTRHENVSYLVRNDVQYLKKLPAGEMIEFFLTKPLGRTALTDRRKNAQIIV